MTLNKVNDTVVKIVQDNVFFHKKAPRMRG